MTPEEKKYLSDILMAIDKVGQFTKEVDSFESYLADSKTQSAVERQIGIIGEATSKLRKLESIRLQHDRQMISMRNRLVHAYDSIDSTIIWAIVKNHLPPLKAEVAELFND